jgi:hypothetical protein
VVSRGVQSHLQRVRTRVQAPGFGGRCLTAGRGVIDRSFVSAPGENWTTCAG